MTNFKFDSASKYPMYYQLYLWLKNEIYAGNYKAGETLPSENEMIEAFKVSRITVRQAIAELENDGLIKKHRGKGSIVLPVKTNSSLDSLNSFTENAELNGERATYIILSTEVLEANGKTADALNVQIGDKIFELKRLLMLNGRIAGYTIAYMPYRKEWENMFFSFDENSSLFRKLNDLDVIIDYATETIEVVAPSQTVRRELRIDNNDPVVKSKQYAYGSNNEVIVYTKTYFLYNKFRYTITTKREKN